MQKFDNKILDKRLEKIDKSGSKIIIGTTAAIDVKFKGQQYIIAALGYLKKRGILNYEYQLVGTGNQAYLKKVAKKFGVESQVKFLGGIPHEKIFDWLDTIDIYVQPSKQEGLPRALVEAMSRGLPAFGASTGGIPELLDSKYIFKNSSAFRKTKEIACMIMSFNKKSMKEQAKKNFDISMKFKRDLLDKKRNDFYTNFFCCKNRKLR